MDAELMLYVWSFVFPVLNSGVILLNRWTKWPHSWLIGAVAQAGQIAMALMYSSVLPGFVLSILPLMMFTTAWITAVKKQKQSKLPGETT